MLKENRIRKILDLSQRSFGKYKLQIVILTALGFLGGLLEGVGVNAIIPLFSFLTNNKNQGDDAITEVIKKIFLYFDINFGLKYLLIFISVLFITKAFVLILSGYIGAKIATDYEEQTRNNLFKKILKASWPHLLKQKLGHLENVLMIDVERGGILLLQISNTIIILMSLLTYILVAVNISFYITLITLILGGLFFLLFKPLIYRTRTIGYRISTLNKKITHFVNENIVGMKTVKILSIERIIIEKIKVLFHELRGNKIKIFLLKNITGSLLQPISLIFICAVFAFSYRAPGFHFAAILATIYLIQRIFQYIQSLQLNLHSMNEAAPYLANVLDYEKIAVTNEEKNNGLGDFIFKNTLEFKNVSFSYDIKKRCLEDVNFVLKKGETVGLIGPSGAGKTTVVDLILRLFQPNAGHILLDNKDMADIDLEKWRQNIGYVSQDVFLINDTIINNIRFYNDSITDEEIITAAKMADICGFIESCPDKFNTIIGERGIMLSAGQRQRIAIARILARKPKILILDEATSALDNESEMQIQKVVENLKGITTVLIIAHRLSTIMNCDKLMVLENGEIVEQGTLSELLSNDKTYFYKVHNIRN